jgi:tRNA (mo5U34)-methyltransferase
MLKRTGMEASENVAQWREGLAKRRWWHSFELPDGRRIEGVNDLESLKRRIGLFPIPQDLSGKRVLDIGAWDGWFSFETERRGAEVVAVDCFDSKNFRYLHRELHSKVEYRILDVYELTPEKLGRFDIVLFLGVLYHLKHPLLGLERVCALTRDLAAVQTFVSPDTGAPAMEFFETTELGGQFDNWVAPNVACVLAMCRTAGFPRVELLDVNQFSAATVACFRHFEPVSARSGPPTELAKCVHMTSFGLNFNSNRDEYVSCWFTCQIEDLVCADVQARAGDLDSRPVFVGKTGDLWQTNFKLPPGLESGWHEVRIRVHGGAWSNPLRIAVDLPVHVDSVKIVAACDGRTWVPSEIELANEPILSLWVDGLSENTSRSDVRVTIGDLELDVDYVSPWKSGNTSQMNASLPAEIEPGDYPIKVIVAGIESQPVVIKCTQNSGITAHR